MIPSYLNKSVLPHKSGVYIFKDAQGKVLYVGKAIDIYHRVASYFNRNIPIKTASLVEKIRFVETIVVESELESLILEANLIKKFLPPYNVMLTDDKDYLYIGITREAFPKVTTLRRMDLKKVKQYWGPFPSARTVRDTLKLLRKVFPWCSNPPKKASFLDNGATLETAISRRSAVITKTRFRPCFYYHLELCPGACVGLISREDLNRIISRFSMLLDGGKEKLVDEMTEEMNEASNQQEFEQASKIKRTLDGINYLTQTNRVQFYLEDPNFLQREARLALEQLQKDLNLPKIPERIEGYDVSNIQGKQATGSMVVLTNGDIDKSQYRKFKIQISGRPNDVAMIQEVVKRRLKHRGWPLPDLIIVDGGKGQVNAVHFQLQASHLQLPVYGLAKRQEWLYPPEGEISASLGNSRKARIIKLSKKSLSLKVLLKLRDEAHRFALSYHRKLRGKNALLSSRGTKLPNGQY